MRPRHAARWILAAILGLVPASHHAAAAALDVPLVFTSLPSAQGFTYTPSGAHAGVPEANVFSVAGGILFQNTMGQSNGVLGGSLLYVRSGGITTTDTKQILVRARCLEAEGSANATLGQGGLYYGFTNGSVQYGFGFTPSRVFVLQPSGTVVVAGTFDNTAFHDWLFDWTPPGSFRVYRDGVQVYSGSGGFAVAANRIFLGDGTGGANARAETASFRFIQDVATPAVSRSWGSVKGDYRGR